VENSKNGYLNLVYFIFERIFDFEPGGSVALFFKKDEDDNKIKKISQMKIPQENEAFKWNPSSSITKEKSINFVLHYFEELYLINKDRFDIKQEFSNHQTSSEYYKISILNKFQRFGKNLRTESSNFYSRKRIIEGRIPRSESSFLKFKIISQINRNVENKQPTEKKNIEQEKFDRSIQVNNLLNFFFLDSFELKFYVQSISSIQFFLDQLRDSLKFIKENNQDQFFEEVEINEIQKMIDLYSDKMSKLNELLTHKFIFFKNYYIPLNSDIRFDIKQFNDKYYFNPRIDFDMDLDKYIDGLNKKILNVLEEISKDNSSNIYSNFLTESKQIIQKFLSDLKEIFAKIQKIKANFLNFESNAEIELKKCYQSKGSFLLLMLKQKNALETKMELLNLLNSFYLTKIRIYKNSLRLSENDWDFTTN
jgi:hypothetical protein